MGKEAVNRWGRISISDEVIATVAGVAATECYGIVGMASRKLKDGIAELLRRENLSRGVEVNVEGDEVGVSLYIIVGYGTRISEVAKNVTEQVKYSVESMTGLRVSRVNILVQGVKVGNER
ncbi:MAG: Asp23/Gls24 family envelope stress response protein [Bacillota bacterium]